VDKENKGSKTFGAPMDTPVGSSELKDLYRRLQPSMRRQKPGPDAIAEALEAAQRLAAEAEAEDAAADVAHDLAAEPVRLVCRVCGYPNREGNKFCGMCGVAAAEKGPGTAAGLAERQPANAIVPALSQFPEHVGRPPATQPTGYETHHYHHHYHHHYFPGGVDGPYPRAGAEPVREEKLRSSPNAAMRGDMSRAEAAVRQVTQEWVLACNTKHLDDLLELYVSDALVLRSNYPPIRGQAAVREFFFGALDAGLGEVELEPLRVEIAGELAYEAGRCKALIPSSTGKRREERGKYLWVCARQSNGEWKLAADCWSSDLMLTTLEAEVPANIAVKTSVPKKNS
jgi:ketosteroid isomerase-like protein